MAVFDSQITGGKRYDLAFEGRNRANATYFKSHSVDVASSVSFAMDMTSLIQDEARDPLDFIWELLQHFTDDVETRLQRMRWFCPSLGNHHATFPTLALSASTP